MHRQRLGTQALLAEAAACARVQSCMHAWAVRTSHAGGPAGHFNAAQGRVSPFFTNVPALHSVQAASFSLEHAVVVDALAGHVEHALHVVSAALLHAFAAYLRIAVS